MIVENTRVVPIIDPVDVTAGVANSLWVNMAFWRRCAICLFKGAWAGGTSAVTLNQAKTNAGGSTKALAFAFQYSGIGNAQTAGNDQLVKNAVTSNTFNLSTVAHLFHIVEVHCQDLDITNGFAWLNVTLAAPSSTDLCCAIAILADPAYAGLPSTLPSALG